MGEGYPHILRLRRRAHVDTSFGGQGIGFVLVTIVCLVRLLSFAADADLGNDFDGDGIYTVTGGIMAYGTGLWFRFSLAAAGLLTSFA